MATLNATLDLDPQTIIATRVLHDATNVHSVAQFTFQSNRAIPSLSGRIITANTVPSVGSIAQTRWKIMSYRATQVSDASSWQYSCLCYPDKADARTSESPSLPVMLAKLRVTTPGPGTSFSNLLAKNGNPASLGVVDVNYTLPANWTLAYALMQLKLQKFKEISLKANPDTWASEMGKLPIYYLSGTTLLATSLNTLYSLGQKSIDQNNQSTELPTMVNAQKIHQTALSNYMLSGNERARTFQFMNAALFQKVFQYQTNRPPAFLSSYGLSSFLGGSSRVADADPDWFQSGNFLFYRAYFDSTRPHAPWTVTMGALK